MLVGVVSHSSEDFLCDLLLLLHTHLSLDFLLFELFDIAIRLALSFKVFLPGLRPDGASARPLKGGRLRSALAQFSLAVDFFSRHSIQLFALLLFESLLVLFLALLLLLIGGLFKFGNSISILLKFFKLGFELLRHLVASSRLFFELLFKFLNQVVFLFHVFVNHCSEPGILL